jgi:hypothetical protein
MKEAQYFFFENCDYAYEYKSNTALHLRDDTQSWLRHKYLHVQIWLF